VFGVPYLRPQNEYGNTITITEQNKYLRHLVIKLLTEAKIRKYNTRGNESRVLKKRDTEGLDEA
jgi:hypothetical protein